MTNHRPMFGRALMPVAAAFLVLAGSVAATPPPTVPSAQSSVNLEYKMPANRALTYQITAEESQVLDIMGQTTTTSTATVSHFTFKAKGMKEKDLLLGVTVDDISMSITGPQGDMSPDMSSVKGKSFDMVLSPLGNEVDVSGAEAISYSLEGESRNLSSGFKTFFPDLPGKAVKIGDTWPSSASVEEKMTSMTIQIGLEYVHTLDGIEMIDGVECARVVSQVTGSINGSGSQMGQDMTFAGTTKGKDIWYFAIKDGQYIKATSESTSEVSIDVPAAGMAIPMTMTSKTELKLTGKS
jgi:hypothetical protein